MIGVRVNTHLEIASETLTERQQEVVRAALTIPNPERIVAEREMVWDWESLPETIELWREEDGILRLPRGFASQLGSTIRSEIWWEDERVSVPLAAVKKWRNPILRDYQEPAATAIVKSEQGVYVAPTGSGKTVTVLETIRRIGQRSLVIVNNTHIARQWMDRAREHLGLCEDDIGLVGDGVWREAGITLAVQQTLWSRRDSLDGWWQTWGLVALDECHHVPANTFFDIIQRFPALYRVGVSATPDKNVELRSLVSASLGPVIHETEESVLVEAGVIERASYEILNSDFSFTMWPTHRAKKDKKTGKLACEYQDRGCDRKGIVHRNNWTDLVAALVEDEDRNDLIAEAIARHYNEGRAILVLSRRLKHLDEMARATIRRLGSAEDVYRLSGKEKTDEKMDLYERAEAGRLVIFSTIGDEALDIPRLDTLVLAFPTKQGDLVRQQIGRVLRAHARKALPVVVDVRDDVGTLVKHLKVRLGVYKSKKMSQRHQVPSAYARDGEAA